jgi:hypothetical protein
MEFGTQLEELELENILKNICYVISLNTFLTCGIGNTLSTEILILIEGNSSLWWEFD